MLSGSSRAFFHCLTGTRGTIYHITYTISGYPESRVANSACPATLKAIYCPLKIRALGSSKCMFRLVTERSWIGVPTVATYFGLKGFPRYDACGGRAPCTRDANVCVLALKRY